MNYALEHLGDGIRLMVMLGILLGIAAVIVWRKRR